MLRYSSMRPQIQNTWRTCALRQTTSRNTQSHRHASRCSCATSSRIHSTTPIMGISHNRLRYLRPLGNPSTSVQCAIRSSFRTRSRDGTQLMAPIAKGRADRSGTRLQNCSRCVAVFCYVLFKSKFSRAAIFRSSPRPMSGLRVPPQILPL